MLFTLAFVLAVVLDLVAVLALAAALTLAVPAPGAFADFLLAAGFFTGVLRVAGDLAAALAAPADCFFPVLPVLLVVLLVLRGMARRSPCVWTYS
ncbi:hypothetical protein [Parahaliea mediterranea]|uniref:hypothetical protein n=1 Tax=Parahaliea mediterranea TaxID=651086 RepID=UPI000E2E51C0|nr:hypothetical protein [Parahaliea mediterranea]